MRTIAWVLLFFVLPACARAQCDGASSSERDVNPKQFLYRGQQIAYKLHQNGSFDDELRCRTKLSKAGWEMSARSPRVLDQYDTYNFLFSNELQLAFLLEGKHQWDEAENVYRHNQQQLAHLKIAGNDIKSENELGLAHLLFSNGKIEEAQKICSHWKDRIKHNADFATEAVKTNIPTPPLYDTPDVEIARWELACGDPQRGEDMLRTQIAAHPDMLASYSALGNYFLETGAFSKAIELTMQERRLRNRAKN